jgi:hypothetical protein
MPCPSPTLPEADHSVRGSAPGIRGTRAPLRPRSMQPRLGRLQCGRPASASDRDQLSRNRRDVFWCCHLASRRSLLLVVVGGTDQPSSGGGDLSSTALRNTHQHINTSTQHTESRPRSSFHHHPLHQATPGRLPPRTTHHGRTRAPAHRHWGAGEMDLAERAPDRGAPGRQAGAQLRPSTKTTAC